MDPNITSVRLPCKCYLKFKDLPIQKKAGKYYIQYYKCDEHNYVIKDSFLKRTAHNKYKIIEDSKEERKEFAKEENFLIDIFNTHLGECSNCNERLFGKNIIEWEHIRNNDWDLTIKCPKCGKVESYYIDEKEI